MPSAREGQLQGQPGAVGGRGREIQDGALEGRQTKAEEGAPKKGELEQIPQQDNACEHARTHAHFSVLFCRGKSQRKYLSIHVLHHTQF